MDTGEYVAGLRSGKGVMLLPDGGTYTGEFAGDKFEGTGTYEYPDGSCYVGAWLGGKKHGSGACGLLQARLCAGSAIVRRGLEAVWPFSVYVDVR